MRSSIVGIVWPYISSCILFEECMLKTSYRGKRSTDVMDDPSVYVQVMSTNTSLMPVDLDLL
jgi:hypothetical protein